MEALRAQFQQSFIEGDRWLAYLKGLKVSLLVTLGALAIGVVLGILVAVVRTLHDQKRGRAPIWLVLVNKICQLYTTIIRGTPMMVQLLIMNFVIFSTSRNRMGIAILALGINSGAYTAEIIRSGIMSIDPGQMEAGRSLGMGYATVMKDVVIPQAIKNILPALGNELITLFKDTSLVTVIGLVDLTKAAQQIQAKTYQAFMPFIGIAVMYLIVVMILTWLLGILERRMRASDRR
ncbi:MAG: amino acid ABC transporter permease [Lachnospiraceae bacterium]|nr:amino acid ABC transporter permease [Lachnospiraceae bacterium]